jgi:AcrR family transcriptional regulator
MQKPSIRQQEIILKAGELINIYGIKGLTTKKLAVHMGFTEGAIYRHFKAKEDIVLMLINEVYASMQLRLSGYPKRELSFDQNLIEIFKSHFNFFACHKHYLTAIMSEGLINETPATKQAIIQIMFFKQKLLLELVDIGRQNDELRADIDAETLVHIIMGSFRLALLQWKLSEFTTDLNVEGEKIINGIILLFKLKK